MTLTRWMAAVFVGAVLAAGLGRSQARAEAASTLLEKGIYEEQTAGNLDAAMAIFQRIAVDGQANRRQAAQARYHLGLCQLKKKQPDAAAQSFRTVVAQYADQKDIVEQADKQLAAAQNGNGGGAVNGGHMQKRAVGKAVAIFPQPVDLSTPEGAAVAWNRASGKMDAASLANLSWLPLSQAELDRVWKSADKKDIETYNKSQLNGVIIEVLTYKDDLAGVITLLSFPPGVGRSPYSLRYLGQANGQWKNMGEDRLASVGEARQTFERKMQGISDSFHQTQTGLSVASRPGALKDVTIREINKTVPEFPEQVDLSTPEGACVAWQRANARMDAKAVTDLSAVPIDPQEEQQFYKRLRSEDPENVYLKAVANAKVVQVLVYKDDLAEVITYLPFPPGKGREPYSGRGLVRSNGQWKNIGEDRFPSVEMAVGKFNINKEASWKYAQGLLAGQGRAKGSPEVDADRQKAIDQVFADPEPIVAIANKIFEAIRTADYDRWINGEGWGSFPMVQYYQTYQWYDVLVPWICKTFKADPIKDVSLGKVTKNEDGLPAIPYKLTLASGKVMEGVLPFNHKDGRWYARWGLDWHLGDRMRLTEAKKSPPPASGPATVEVRDINRPVSAFTAGDLSSPESAAANYNRASGGMDAKALAAVSLAPVDQADMQRSFDRNRADMEVYNKAQMTATIVRVLSYRDGVAMVITKLNFPEGVGRHPYSGRMFGLFNGQWKNMGEDRYPNPEAAQTAFEKVKDMIWDDYAQTIQGQNAGGGGGSVDAATGGSEVYRAGGSREETDAHQREAEQHPEIIEAEARSFFEVIRTADYPRWLEGNNWTTFPLRDRYETHTGWPGLVEWMGNTFKQNPIVDVQLGQAVKNAHGLMGVHYRLALKDGAVLEGDLPFYWDGNRWCGMHGIDWHLKYKGKPLVAGAGGSTTQPAADARTTR